MLELYRQQLVVTDFSAAIEASICTECPFGVQKIVLTLYTVSGLIAVMVSFGSKPYTYLAPKKLFLQHLHEHDTSGRIHRSVYAVGAVDSVPVDYLLKKLPAGLQAVERSGWEWQVAFLMKTTIISLVSS